MIPCQTASDHLWDWLQEGAGHPLHREMDAHLAACGECRARRDTLATLRSRIKETMEPAPSGFAERLQSRLSDARAHSRFEPDPWLEEVEEPAAAVLVDRRHPAWWRPLALVASGAAAVLAFGLLLRQPLSTGDGTLSPRALVEEQGPTPAAGDSTIPGAAMGGTSDPETGLLAERPYEEDSSQAPSRLPEGRERLTPVGTTP